MTAREPCGCKHDGRKWLELCPTHREEHDARHEMAHAEHLARAKPGTYVYETVNPDTLAPEAAG